MIARRVDLAKLRRMRTKNSMYKMWKNLDKEKLRRLLVPGRESTAPALSLHILKSRRVAIP